MIPCSSQLHKAHSWDFGLLVMKHNEVGSNPAARSSVRRCGCGVRALHSTHRKVCEKQISQQHPSPSRSTNGRWKLCLFLHQKHGRGSRHSYLPSITWCCSLQHRVNKQCLECAVSLPAPGRNAAAQCSQLPAPCSLPSDGARCGRSSAAQHRAVRDTSHLLLRKAESDLYNHSTLHIALSRKWPENFKASSPPPRFFLAGQNVITHICVITASRSTYSSQWVITGKGDDEDVTTGQGKHSYQEPHSDICAFITVLSQEVTEFPEKVLHIWKGSSFQKSVSTLNEKLMHSR